MIKCCICKREIVKYKIDLGDTIVLEKNGETLYVCDNCAKEILNQIGDRL